MMSLYEDIYSWDQDTVVYYINFRYHKNTAAINDNAPVVEVIKYTDKQLAFLMN
jgi:hypothetical protein